MRRHSQPAPVDRSASKDAGPGTVLIVEDEAIVALDFEERVRRLGYQVVGVTGDGAEAVCQAMRLRPDVVLMDIRLKGGVDGVDAAMLIHGVQSTPIIFITAFGDTPTLQKVLADSPTGFLLKPVDDRELEVALRAARLHDQTIRKLRKGEAWLAAMLRTVTDGVIATRRDGTVKYMNPTAERLTGWKRDEAIGAAFDEVVRTVAGGPKDLGLAEGTLRKQLVCRDGGEHDIELEACPLDDSGVAGGKLWMLRDVAERERIQQGQALLAELSTIFTRSLGEPFPFTDVARSIVRSFADWCVIDLVDGDGPTRGRLVRRSAVAKSSHEQRAALERILSEKLQSEGSDDLGALVSGGQSAELLPESLDAQQLARHLRLDAASLRDFPARSLISVPLTARGKTFGVMTMIRERRRYDAVDLGLAHELALRIATAADNVDLFRRTQRAVEMRDEVLAIVSHDLRSPLTTIAVNVDMLLQKAALADSAQDGSRRLAAIRDNTRRMKRLIGDLLDVASIDAGRLTVNRQACAATDLLRQAGVAFEALAMEKRLRLVVEPVARELQLSCDRERVLQVLSNLLANAIRFTPEDGSIKVSLEHRGRYARFAIADSGAGIAPDQIPHLFERRWQAPQTRSGGFGLGLYVVHGIVQAHGGELSVESALGVGSTFYFTIPVADGSEAAR